MQYEKPFLSLDDQIALLKSRGMQDQEGILRDRLQSVGYYRLSGYWYPFRVNEGDHFKPNTEFRRVWDRYVFDRRLRLLCLDALERIEIALKSLVSYHHSAEFGPFGYVQSSGSLPGFKTQDLRVQFIKNVEKEVNRSKEIFVTHFKKRYETPIYRSGWPSN